MRKILVLCIVCLLASAMTCQRQQFDPNGVLQESIELRLDENTLFTLQSTYALLLDSFERIQYLRAQAALNGFTEEVARLDADIQKRQLRLTEIKETIHNLAEAVQALRDSRNAK